jgi:hypothetical protein
VSEDENRQGMQEEDQDEVEAHKRAVQANDDGTSSEGEDEVEGHMRKGHLRKG